MEAFWQTILRIFEQNKTVILWVLAFLVLYIIVMIAIHMVHKANNKKYLAAHPDAARVYMKWRIGITNESVTVYAVNDEKARTFTKGIKRGFYVPSGQSEIQVSYSHQRPGVFYRSVTSTTDVVKKTIETEPNGSYMLGFDRKKKVFTFEKFTK